MDISDLFKKIMESHSISIRDNNESNSSTSMVTFTFDYYQDKENILIALEGWRFVNIIDDIRNKLKNIEKNSEKRRFHICTIIDEFNKILDQNDYFNPNDF